MNMYETFKEMVKDIFDNEDFIQFCYINGFKYKCLVSAISNEFGFTEVGLVDYVNFTLDIQIADITKDIPKENDKILFRKRTYKVSHVDIDSALATCKIYLISTSKGK